MQTFNLRRTSTAKSNPVAESTTNVNVAAILEKANAIRQVIEVLYLFLLFSEFYEQSSKSQIHYYFLVCASQHQKFSSLLIDPFPSAELE